MSRQKKGMKTLRLQVTIDATTERVIQQMVKLGIHGASKSEVACSVIRHWLWDNQEKLRDNGITIAPRSSTP